MVKIRVEMDGAVGGGNHRLFVLLPLEIEGSTAPVRLRSPENESVWWEQGNGGEVEAVRNSRRGLGAGRTRRRGGGNWPVKYLWQASKIRLSGFPSERKKHLMSEHGRGNTGGTVLRGSLSGST